jgi:hypothetical protein
MKTWLSGLLLALALTTSVQAQPAQNRAGLVVQYADGEVETVCVNFGEAEISGLDLLERSGIPVVVQGASLGAAVCKIGPDGCDYPGESCFCERDGARSTYWAFYMLQDGTWAYATMGVANTTVRDGSVHGWAWGAGESGSGVQPPPRSIEQVCPPQQAADSATRPPAAAPADTPVAVSAPTARAAEPASGGAGLPVSYIGFAILALILIAGAVVAARR